MLSVFDRVYDSAWHHPVMCWVGAVVVVAWLLKQRAGRARPAAGNFLWWFALLWQVEIALDALCSGAWPPLPSDSRVAEVLAVVFVSLGDMRYFQLVEHFAPRSGPPGRGGRALLWAIAWSWLIPALSGLLRLALPGLFAERRVIYLVYEVLFLLLMGGFARWLLPRRLPGVSAQQVQLRRWLQRVTALVAVQYGLWALADVIILCGARSGLLLRLLPNFIYYVAFVPLAYLWAPRVPGPSEGA